MSEHPDASIESPKRFKDKKSGRKREHDVVITTKTGHHELTIAIECRDRSNKIGSPQMEGFWAKCLNTGINQGIIVSSKGFTKPALKLAAHYGIRCLNLEEAFSFNWLLPQGVTLYNRQIEETNWTLIPETTLDKKLEDYELVDNEGNEVQKDIINKNAYTKLREQDPLSERLGSNKRGLVFNGNGIYLRDKKTKEVFKLKNLIADLSYELTSQLAPFNCFKYSDEITGKDIAEAAYAPIEVGEIKGQLMIVQKEGGGGKIVFINKKDK